MRPAKLASEDGSSGVEPVEMARDEKPNGGFPPRLEIANSRDSHIPTGAAAVLSSNQNQTRVDLAPNSLARNMPVRL